MPNPSGRTPSGLNAAIHASRYEVVVRVDGHALLPGNYVSTAVETLARTGADNVGGIMNAEGETPFEQAVARAMTTPMGVGAAPFHVGGGEGEAETVYLGCFRKTALQRVGGYDETFLRAQDWEMNHRIRETGGLVWFNPALVVTYRPRPDASSLAEQYFHYGRWRREVMRRHPETASRTSALRYFAPPVAVVGVVAGAAAGLVGSTVGPRALRIGWLAPRRLPRPDHRRGCRGRSWPAAGRARPLAAGLRHHARRVGDRLPDLATRTARARGVRALVRGGPPGPMPWRSWSSGSRAWGSLTSSCWLMGTAPASSRRWLRGCPGGP